MITAAIFQKSKALSEGRGHLRMWQTLMAFTIGGNETRDRVKLDSEKYHIQGKQWIKFG